MTQERANESIIAAYEWRPGDCFRCAAREVPTAHVGALLDGEAEIRACENCLLSMEEERRRDAARRGGPYEPGSLGER